MAVKRYQSEEFEESRQYTPFREPEDAPERKSKKLLTNDLLIALCKTTIVDSLDAT